MSLPLLQVRDLRIDFAQPRPAVAGVDVHVERGEVVALVGESGSGKSMTARAVLGLLPPGARATGSIEVLGEQVLGADEATLNRIRGTRVALVFQEPQTALNPVRRIGWHLRQALGAHTEPGRAASKAEISARALELLRQVDLPDPESKLEAYPHQLSGGQKQRVAIALALAGEPDLLIADEPTTALDVTVQAEILDLLGSLRETTGMGILLITHNMGVVAERADRVVVLNTGHVVETAPTGELFTHPREPYTRQLLAAVPRMPLPDAALVPVPPRPEGTALLLDEVSVVHPARRGVAEVRAVDRVSLDVRRGEVLGLVGESGSGKTTIGRVVAGLTRPTTGRVEIDSQDLAGLDRSALLAVRRHVALVHQDPASSLDPRFTVAEAIREPLDIHRVGTPAQRRRKVADLIAAVRLPEDLADRRPRRLSGGQRQRVALARALVLEPHLVIADEPTSALDVSVQAEVLRLFTDLQREHGFACIFISHDLAVVHQVSDRVAVLRQGQLVENGPVDTVYHHPRDPYTRALLAAVPVPDPAPTQLISQEVSA